MAARCAAAFGRTHSLAGSQNGSAYPTAQAKKNDPRFRGPTCRRRRWYGGAVRRGLRPNPFARRLAKWVRYTTAQAKKTGPRKGGRPVGGGGGMAARCAAAFGRTHSLAGSRNGSAYPTAQAKQNSPSMRDCFVWRRRWDSNPRGDSTYLISSQGRYDHFDTPPRPFHYKQTRANCQAREGCRRATG